MSLFGQPLWQVRKEANLFWHHANPHAPSLPPLYPADMHSFHTWARRSTWEHWALQRSTIKYSLFKPEPLSSVQSLQPHVLLLKNWNNISCTKLAIFPEIQCNFTASKPFFKCIKSTPESVSSVDLHRWKDLPSQEGLHRIISVFLLEKHFLVSQTSFCVLLLDSGQSASCHG